MNIKGGNRAWIALVMVALLVDPITPQKVTKVHDELAKLVEKNGGKVGFRVAKPCGFFGKCARGCLATQNYKEGDLIAEVPFSMAIAVGYERDHSAANAYVLADMRINDPAHNATYDLFWKTQPEPDEVFSPDMWEDHHFAELQSTVLADLARQHRTYTTAYYKGEVDQTEPVPQRLKASGPSLKEFLWYSSIVVTRAFSFWHGGDTEGQRSRTYLFPSIDMVNHDENPNTERKEHPEDGVVRVRALKAIKKGEELTQLYHDELLHRPDMSLMVYGFVGDTDKPLLPASDLPTYDPASPYEHTAASDNEYIMGIDKDELARLKSLTHEWTTTLEADEALLRKGFKDWRMEQLVRFRVMRKRALSRVIKTAESTLTEL